MPIRKYWAMGMAAIALATATSAGAQAENDSEALLREIQALRAEQQAIRKDLAEIKKLLDSGSSNRSQRRERPPFAPRDLEVGDSFVIGNADAPVTLFSYSDYHCPFCRRHAQTVLPELVKKYAQTGQLRIVMREMPIDRLHPRAPAAAQAAVCAGRQGQYMQMHDLLFAEKKKHSDDDLKDLGRSLGLETEAYEACLADPEVAERIAADGKEAKSMNITGTPGFALGPTDAANPGTVHATLGVRGAQSLQYFEAAIAKVMEDAAEDGEDVTEDQTQAAAAPPAAN